MRLLYDQDPNQGGMLQINQGATSMSRSRRTSNGGQGVSASRGRRHQKSKKEDDSALIRRGGDRGGRPEHLPEYVAVARSARSDLPGDECCRPTLRMAHGWGGGRGIDGGGCSKPEEAGATTQKEEEISLDQDELIQSVSRSGGGAAGGGWQHGC